MEPVVFLIFALLLLAITLIILLKIRQRSAGVKEDGGAVTPAARAADRPVQTRRAAVVRNRARVRVNHDFNEDADVDAAAEQPAETAVASDGKIGAKKMAKLQAKAEKKLQRENELREREERKEREERAAVDAKKRELAAEQLEAARLEAERVEREKREQQEHEEYLKMREQFQVDEEGFDEDAEVGSDNLLEEFISYVKRVKVVMLEDLAAEFKLKTQDTIDRLQALIQQERLTGVIDDRGKFIYIDSAELRTVADFVNRRGRVSLSDLVESSNTLISLEPECSAVTAST